jgi:hypothetical protein
MIEGASRLTGNPSPADIDYQRAGWLQETLKLYAELLEPINIFVALNISVVLLPNQSEWRAGND